MIGRPKVVLLGMLTKMPVAGVTWLVGQYAVGFRRLGFDVYYVEAHARTPSMFMAEPGDDPTAKAVAFLETQLERFGLSGKWALHALHADGRLYGMSRSALDRLYGEAELIVNMHGGTRPLPEHAATDRLLYLGSDPGEVEFEIERGDARALEALDQHTWFFTWGLNYGNADCRLPWSRPFHFHVTPPPVVTDHWANLDDAGPATVMTTVGNWRQPWRDIVVDGERYHWSKHHEFLKVLDVPRRTARTFELALGSFQAADQLLLESHGWLVRPASSVSVDSETYRRYIGGSRGEFSVAKDQNVRLRTGWFSERSATYLAAGRPVIVQDTGFGSCLPTGLGLLPFSDLDSAVDAVERLNADYPRHRRAAFEIAREHLDAERVLRLMLAQCGISVPVPRRRRLSRDALDAGLELTPESRRPLVLAPGTTAAINARAIPACPVLDPPRVSLIMVTHGKLPVTRLAIESILTATPEPAYELIVVDNASEDATPDYLDVVASRNPQVRVLANTANQGFAAAANRGLRAAAAPLIVLINNDVVVPPGWLPRLTAPLVAADVGAAGPVTNRCGTWAEIATTYRTYGEFVVFDAERAASHAGQVTEVPMLAMFCTALRRDVVDAVGLLDEGFGLGMFEDDDYARRLAAAGLRMLCVEDVVVHHFGEASFSELYADGIRSRLFEANRRRFEHKWGVRWEPHRRRDDDGYASVVAEVRSVVSALLADEGVVAVVSKGDEQLVTLPDATVRHFPGGTDGQYVWYHPADDRQAVSELQLAEAAGLTHLVVPEPSYWWLEHYHGLAAYLDARYERVDDVGPRLAVFRRIVSPPEPTRIGALAEELA